MREKEKQKKLLELEFLEKVNIIRSDANEFQRTQDMRIFGRMRIDVGFLAFMAQAALSDGEITQDAYNRIMSEILVISATVKDTLEEIDDS